MSDLQKQSLSASDLTSYNVDGLELFFTSNRKVRASQSAIARMCGVTETTIRNDLRAIEEKGVILDVVLAQGRSATEKSRSNLHNSSTIKILLKKRNPERLEQFLDFGIDEGLAQLAGVPLPVQTTQLSSTQRMKEMAQDVLKWVAIQEAAECYPGDKRDMEYILSGQKVLLSENMTVQEMAEANSITLVGSQSAEIGGMLSGHLRTKNECKLITKKVARYKQENGKYQKSTRNAYPAILMPRFLSAYEAIRIDK